ncbi:MAG: copper homeostasis protein CutC [Micromonosporaceae bacterium]
MIRVEICVDDVAGAAAAAAGGAHRVELCAGLSEGGTTPTPGFLRHSRRTAPDLGFQVLVRPRPGDFVYSPSELDVMVADIESVRSHVPPGGLGFTLGALTPGGAVDETAIRRLVAACDGAPVTFHKAFDAIVDKPAALARLSALGVAKVMTSGGGGPAVRHLNVLADLVRLASDEVGVVVAGGVRAGNAAAVVRATGAREIHLRAQRTVPSASRTGGSEYDPGTRTATCTETVAAVVAAVAAIPRA